MAMIPIGRLLKVSQDSVDFVTKFAMSLPPLKERKREVIWFS